MRHPGYMWLTRPNKTVGLGADYKALPSVGLEPFVISTISGDRASRYNRMYKLIQPSLKVKLFSELFEAWHHWLILR